MLHDAAPTNGAESEKNDRQGAQVSVLVVIGSPWGNAGRRSLFPGSRRACVEGRPIPTEKNWVCSVETGHLRDDGGAFVVTPFSNACEAAPLVRRRSRRWKQGKRHVFYSQKTKLLIRCGFLASFCQKV